MAAIREFGLGEVGIAFFRGGLVTSTISRLGRKVDEAIRNGPLFVWTATFPSHPHGSEDVMLTMKFQCSVPQVRRMTLGRLNTKISLRSSCSTLLCWVQLLGCKSETGRSVELEVAKP